MNRCYFKTQKCPCRTRRVRQGGTPRTRGQALWLLAPRQRGKYKSNTWQCNLLADEKSSILINKKHPRGVLFGTFRGCVVTRKPRDSEVNGVHFIYGGIFIFGAFRCGNNPPVLPGGRKESGAIESLPCVKGGGFCEAKDGGIVGCEASVALKKSNFTYRTIPHPLSRELPLHKGASRKRIFLYRKGVWMLTRLRVAVRVMR